MAKAVPGIGLDIGSRKIKLVRVKKGARSLQIVKLGSIPTPPGAVEAGNIYNPEKLGYVVGELAKKLNLKGGPVTSAVSGPQVYTRNLVMPRMKLEELKEAVKYEATTFLPIPVEESAMDVLPLRNFEDEEGKKVEVFLVAVRRQQVENLQSVCKHAGLKLEAVEIEPLAINRVISTAAGSGPKAFLNIGTTRSYFSVFQDGVLVFNRYLSFGSSAFYQNQNSDIEGQVEGGDNIQIIPGQEDYLVRDIIAEVARSVEYYTMQNPLGLGDIYLCGGGSRLQGLDKAIASGINCAVQVANPLDLFSLPSDLDEYQQRELRYDFTVALGLAVRGVK